MSRFDHKAAVVLSGGGAYGAFEIGVLKALCNGECPSTSHKSLDASIFSGTSVGSFNASAMCMTPGASASAAIDRLEQIWFEKVADRGSESEGNGVFRLRGNPVRSLDLSISSPARALIECASDAGFFAEDLLQRFASFTTNKGSIPHRAMGFVDLSSFLSIDPFRRTLSECLNLEGIRTNKEKELFVVATNWGTGAAKTFTKADMTDEEGLSIIMASSAIPGIFPPVLIHPHIYVDGGVVMNTPLACALEAGATELHVIFLDPDISTIAMAPSPNTVDTFSRMYSIMLATKINEDIATAEWINLGLDALERATKGEHLSPEDDRHFLRVAGKILKRAEEANQYRKLTIHRYNPSEDLGGLLGMLDFAEDTIAQLVEKGFKCATHHDCAESGCLLPHKTERVSTAAQTH